MSRKRKLSESVKKEVAHRQNYICCKCGQILPPTYQTDHIIPHSISNDDSFENLQALCPNCHSLKTQRENIRIIKFKSLLSKFTCENTNLCWFCLESVNDMEDHLKSCSKILKDINKTILKPKIKVSSLDEMLAMHVYDDSSSIVVNKLKNMKISDSKEVSNILYIEIGLHDFSITVNNEYKHKTNGDISALDVGEAVCYGTRSKKYSKKIDTIEILLSDNEIERDEEDKNACYNYLCDVLLEYLPERLFKKDTDIIFIV